VRLIIKIDSAVSGNKEMRQRFAASVAALFRDGHLIVVIHGETLNDLHTQPGLSSNQVSFAAGVVESSVAAAMIRGGLLADALSRIGLPSAALSCNGLGICQVRKSADPARRNFTMEISSINPGWLDFFSNRGGIPIISNIVVGELEECGFVNADHMAAVCAISWNADTMIYLIRGSGITDDSGNAIRWLDVNRVDSLFKELAGDTVSMSLLKSCKQAFTQGVHRVRILPVTDIDLLSLFFFTKIEHGTDLVLSTTIRKEPEVLAG
jgi:acetylglutamate kinase